VSSASLKKFLKRLDKDLKKSSETYRRKTANKLVHVFLYSESTIDGVLKTLLQHSTMTSSGVATKEDLEAGKKEAEAIIRALGKEYKTLLRTLSGKVISKFKTAATNYEGVTIQSSLKARNNISVRIEQRVGDQASRDNFELIRKQYKDNLDTFYKDFLKLIDGPIIVPSTSNKTGFRDISTAGQAFNLEHTQQGSNIKSFMNDTVVDVLNALYKGKDTTLLQQALKDAGLEELELSVSKNAKTGELEVFLGSQIKNVEESKKERKLKIDLQKKLNEVLQKLGTEIILTPGSDSIFEGFRKKTVKKVLTPFKKIKGAKVTEEKTNIEGALSNAILKVSGKVSKGKVPTDSINKESRKSRAKKGVSSAPLHLIGIMNEQLPRVIQKNMNTPALQNRTGRFANSVTVTDISMTAGGFPSIGYTYQKGPYQTFEPGFRQGSVERDPRRLIDKSMREIAMQYAIGRFYTRRV
jgi:hypothetical protein